MFGIGLPEFILIMALALIVVGPDKLPDLARSVAKGILDLKKTANTLKESLTEDGNLLDDIKPELDEAARSIKDQVLDVTNETWTDTESAKRSVASKLTEVTSPIIDVEAAEESALPEQEDDADTGDTDRQEEDSSPAETQNNSDVSEHKN